ncbi:MAG: glycoside hydrolase family 15 protein [Alphaproteobacteria bacterium]|nr:glycoside hydrolase family 15 protein [Acetobacteraceae bacterium]MBV9377506.1 glycoside hydrolase family 15 protein [Alphaproteobacteria bacterium]
MPSLIEDYALIGDCETAALVGRDGSIDWLCWPRFDSDACFAALLGTPEHGRWLVAPFETEQLRIMRRYRRDTLILETRFETPDGAVLLIDLMPPRSRHSNLVRLVVGERGHVVMRMELVIRFEYGALVPWVHRLEDGTLRAIAGADQIVLRTPCPVRGEHMSTVAEFTVAVGETVPFTLTYAPSHLPPPDPVDPSLALAEAEQFWNEWSGRARIEPGEQRDAVMRSLITLKALTHAPTGGIVAAPTTSLPETLGGIRNWDYRFCWLRDATLSLLALMNAGYYDEASAWRDWLLRAVAGVPAQAQIMYGIGGERRLSEWEVDWLPGYEGARPVRIGNGAHGQIQVDVYGEVMDALYQAYRGGLASSEDGWSVQRAFLAHLAEIWREPDRGIWESRGNPRHFTFSKVMAWVAFDRGIRTAEECGLEGPIAEWKAIAEEIHADVCAHGYNAELGSFVQSYGSKWLDGSLLLIPTTGFLPPDDSRIAGTVRAIEGRLLADGFVMRHDPAEVETGLAHGEGAFLACSFWLADAYVLTGRAEDAKRLFTRLLGLRNDVGLLSEEYDPVARRLLGNFPQAFSHIALINTAHNLARSSKPAEQRAGEAELGE